MLVAANLLSCVGDDPDSTGPSAPDASTQVGDGSPTSEAPTLPLTTVRDPSAAKHPALEQEIVVSGVIVTGVKSAGPTHGFFVQDASAKAWGGIFVFLGAADVTVAKGDVVTVTGKYHQYRGLDQLVAEAKPPVKTGTGSVPEPIEVVVADIAAGGARANELQSMLVRVQSVEVTRTANGGVDFGVRPVGVSSGPELLITSFVVGDLASTPFDDTMGTKYASITGFGYEYGPTDATGVPKLAPASKDDLVR